MSLPEIGGKRWHVKELAMKSSNLAMRLNDYIYYQDDCDEELLATLQNYQDNINGKIEDLRKMLEK